MVAVHARWVGLALKTIVFLNKWYLLEKQLTYNVPGTISHVTYDYELTG